MRDQGQVFHVEAFVQPCRPHVSLRRMEEASEGITRLDWKVQDVVLSVASELPEEADPERVAAADENTTPG